MLAKQDVGRYGAVELASIAWSMAALALANERMVDAVAEEVQRKLPQFGAKELSNIAWAYATMELLHAPLLDAVAAAARREADAGRVNALDLTNFTWSFARLVVADLPLFAALAGAAVGGAGAGFAGRDIASTAWSFATVAFVHAPVFEALKGPARAATYEPQSLAMTAWAFSAVSCSDWPLLAALADATGQMLSEFTEFTLARVLWSVASCPVDTHQESEQCSRLVALARAPVIRMGQWGGHTHCLLANALFKARDQLPGDLWRLVESRWEAELEALAELLATVPDAERYLVRLEACGCFHAGPFYSGQLLARLGVEEASETFVAFAQRQLELAGGAGIRCVASFTLEARGEQSEVFTTTSSGAGVEASLPIVAAPLRHDRSGHAEFLAMGWFLESLEAAGMQPGEARGELRLHVTHHPCLSCVGAFAQLRRLCPELALRVSFDVRQEELEACWYRK